MRLGKSLIALVLAFAGVPAALADDVIYLHDAAVLGGSGGGEFRAPCPEDWALTAINVTVGKDMNSISPVCSPKNLGYSYDATTHLNTYGYAKDRPGTASCYPNLVQGMDVETSHVNLVHHLQLICLAPDGGTYPAPLLTADGSAPLTHGGEAQRTERTGCPPGEFAVGIYGRHGSHVDAVGLMCGTVAAPPKPKSDPAPQAQPKPQPPAKPRDAPLPVGGAAGGGNDGNGGGNGGSRGRANTDTTIYDQPEGNDIAYLSAGDPVRIVQCGQPKNWCRISAPEAGWVWGPELDR